MQPILTHAQPSPLELERHRARVHAEWTDEATVRAWQRWHRHLMGSFRELTEALIAAADLRQGQRVLDLACGTGDPALAIAGRLGPTGHVLATDLSAGMVGAARDNAERLGLLNMTFDQADAESLPYPDQRFDRATSRLGAMFWPDAVRAQREIHRVLRPGGRVAELVWGAMERQELFQQTAAVLMRHARVPPPEPGAPWIFRFAAPGSLAATLREAGFRQVREDRTVVDISWPGTPEEMWTSFTELATPWRPLLQALSPQARARVEAEALQGLRKRVDHGRVRLSAEIVVCSAVR